MAFQANCKCKNNCALHKVLTWPKYNVQGIFTKPQISDSNLDSIWHQFHDDEMSFTPILDCMLFDAKWDAYCHSLKCKRNFVGAIKVKHIIQDDKFWA
jgi:hypothetical protein